MKMIIPAAVASLFVSSLLFAEVKINFEMITGVRMGPSDSSVEGAAHFKSNREFVIEMEFPDGVVRESGTYSYDPAKGVLIMNYRGNKGTIRYDVVSSNGRVKLLMENRVAEAPPFILELVYGIEK